MADARTHTARIRLDLPAGEHLLPGQFARAFFTTGATRALAVPATAMLKRGEVTAVYVVDRDGRPQLRQVRVGESVGDRQVEDPRRTVPRRAHRGQPGAGGHGSGRRRPRPAEDSGVANPTRR